MIDKEALEELYEKYNNRESIHPDPLEFLYNYDKTSDREVAGLVAASLAYGKVNQILKSVSAILKFMGPEPSKFLRNSTFKSINSQCLNFKHRFTTGEELAVFLFNIKKILEDYGSVNACFTEYFKGENEILPALLNLIKKLRAGKCDCYNSLVPLPAGKSAYKRLNLYLRWMIRRDNVDPGGWENIPASKLIIPLDTHMHRIAITHQFTKRKQADWNTAFEITESFRKFSPDDPVKYDFALTRMGIKSNNLD
ncbi:MAG: TIGR02757 family protein [Actinobacteria bacterium]|nr:TIGR02757 family protein [Actinomycetota bacterium]